MSLVHGSSIVTSGLTFYYDMNNSKKSWLGAPITNYIPNPYASWNGSSFVLGYNYQNLGATYSYVTGVDNPVSAPGVLEYYTGTTGYKYFSIDSSTLPSTTTYTFSYYARMKSGSAGSFGNSQLWRANGTDRSVTGDWNPTITTDWVRYSTTGPAEASTILQYFPVHSGSITGGYTIQYCGFQLEVGSYATPFVSGTRSSTQAIADIAKRNTITANSLTYASSNTFSFNGSSDFMTLGSVAASSNSARSIFAWIKTSTGSRCIVSTGTPATGQAFNLVTYGSNKIGVMGYNADFYPSSGANVTDNIWHYVGAVANGSGTITTYVDGVVDNTGSVTYSTTGQNNYVGKSNHVGSENYFNGSISNVKIYDRALTTAEIQQNFNALRSRYGS